MISLARSCPRENVFFVWVSLNEQKWVTFAERRRPRWHRRPDLSNAGRLSADGLHRKIVGPGANPNPGGRGAHPAEIASSAPTGLAEVVQLGGSRRSGAAPGH